MSQLAFRRRVEAVSLLLSHFPRPDGVQRGLVGEIIKRFEARGLKLVALKLVQPTIDQAKEHYADLSSKGFYNDLCEYFASGPICAMIWMGSNAVKVGRMILGETNPTASLPGTIRGDFCLELGRNICHGSDALDSSAKERAFWFPEHADGLIWARANEKWIQ